MNLSYIPRNIYIYTGVVENIHNILAKNEEAQLDVVGKWSTFPKYSSSTNQTSCCLTFTYPVLHLYNVQTYKCLRD